MRQAPKEYHAVVMVKNNKRKKRVSAHLIEVVASAEEALEKSDNEQTFPALVFGPSTSSESHQIYYIMKWLR
ncbi:MAG: hypothetical protein HON94_02475 [Methylococcales bacterium]|jgi:hypothetical protein|nr:hypothetical protein [Methylococcales bacterium]MBT7408407.1 hypothetical protein [Methylococcales bacterium]